MANVQLTDLVLIGRGANSYNTTFSDLKESVLDGIEASNDSKYVLVAGDTMTGFLTLNDDPTDALHAVTKQYLDNKLTSGGGLIPLLGGPDEQTGTLDDRYVLVGGDTMTGALLLHDDPAVAMQAVTKQYVDAIESSIDSDITDLSAELQSEIGRATAAELELQNNTAAEVDRALQAESDLNDKIDNLVLDDLSDCSVAGATEDQVLVYNGTNWVAHTPDAVADALEFQGSIDCTTEEAPESPVVGWFYFNTGTGTSLDSWNGITDVTQGDRVVYGNDNQWHILGNINDGGNVTLDSLSVTTVDADGSGALAYNNESGVFTFTPADLDTRIPMNLSALPTLPTL